MSNKTENEQHVQARRFLSQLILNGGPLNERQQACFNLLIRRYLYTLWTLAFHNNPDAADEESGPWQKAQYLLPPWARQSFLPTHQKLTLEQQVQAATHPPVIAAYLKLSMMQGCSYDEALAEFKRYIEFR